MTVYFLCHGSTGISPSVSSDHPMENSILKMPAAVLQANSELPVESLMLKHQEHVRKVKLSPMISLSTLQSNIAQEKKALGLNSSGDFENFKDTSKNKQTGNPFSKANKREDSPPRLNIPPQRAPIINRPLQGLPEFLRACSNGQCIFLNSA